MGQQVYELLLVFFADSGLNVLGALSTPKQLRENHAGKTDITMPTNTLMTSEKNRILESMPDSVWMYCLVSQTRQVSEDGNSIALRRTLRQLLK